MLITCKISLQLNLLAIYGQERIKSKEIQYKKYFTRTRFQLLNSFETFSLHWVNLWIYEPKVIIDSAYPALRCMKLLFLNLFSQIRS